jgi:hypothetical protein
MSLAHRTSAGTSSASGLIVREKQLRQQMQLEIQRLHQRLG